MKKKMGILGGLLMAAVVTGYSVAGTYAKYTSTIDLTDEARIAKWDLTAIDATTSKEISTLNLFADSYSYGEDGLYVKSLNGDDVVAPGTKGEYQVNFAGDMEVRYMLTFALEGADPVMYYGLMNDGRLYTTNTDSFDPTGNGLNEYRPITYTVTLFSGDRTIFTTTGKFDEIQEAINEYSENAGYADSIEPGKMHESLKIEWKWDAENEVDGLTRAQVDALDTYFGTNFGQDVEDMAMREFKLSVTATQVAENHSERSAE